MTPDATPDVERVFRERSRPVVAILLRAFGTARLDSIEDALQGAFAKALIQWPERGMPANPTAWLAAVARNQLVDDLRHRAMIEAKRDETERRWYGRAAEAPSTLEPLDDDDLRLILLCCDPALKRHESLAITLRLACGLDVPMIARALLKREVAVRKAITRARDRLRQSSLSFEASNRQLAEARIDRVLEILYLLFNEGYAAHSGDNLVRRELCVEAMRLAELLLASTVPDRGRVAAVLSLMAFQASRLPARTAGGKLVRLAEQNRSRWDVALIRRGLALLDLSTESRKRSKYHLEAAIAACHAVSPSFDRTDWPRILSLYDDLVQLSPSPVVRLNRSVAVTMVAGAEAGLAAVERLLDMPELDGNHLLPALMADNLRRLGRDTDASSWYRRALDLVMTAPERQFLNDQLNSCFAGFDATDEGV